MGETIDKFHSTPLNHDEKRFLLVDSDGPVTDKNAVCTRFNENKPNRKLDSLYNNTFLMIQEAEAWILSQPDILQNHGISTRKLPQRNVMEIPKPSETLGILYKNSGKEYHKVRDFSKLFPDLNTSRLKDYFDEFKTLIEELSKP